jgi:ADP-ribosylglycohydrolase
LNDDIFSLEESDILSSGYVVHALEASMWCFLTTDNYKDAVLKAVNLGRDTDTTAAITGGLAGLLYGFDSIPSHWTENIAKSKDIEQLALRLVNSIH